MKPSYKAIVLLPAAVLLLAACQHSSQVTAGVLRVTPSSMAACHPAAVADVRWDASRHAGVNTVLIYVGTGSSEKLFAEGGATGDAKTGPWVRPGTVFTAKAKYSGNVLGTVTIAGPTCPSAG
jgi:hypothetical protein